MFIFMREIDGLGRYPVVQVDAGLMIVEFTLSDLEWLKREHISLTGDNRDGLSD